MKENYHINYLVEVQENIGKVQTEGKGWRKLGKGRGRWREYQQTPHPAQIPVWGSILAPWDRDHELKADA